MDAPELEASFDYTEFDGKPVEWWRSYAKHHKRIAPPEDISHGARVTMHTAIPDETLHVHVARVARSAAEGHATVLTTSGQVIQFQEPRPALYGKPASKGAVSIPPDIDAKGITLVMAHFESRGFNLTAAQIPFSKGWTDEAEKDRIRKLWAEVQQKQQPQIARGPEATSRKPNAARQPAFA